MSWKAVEMQVALPRVQDASKIQEQIQQRGQFIQDTLASKQIIQEEIKRKTVNHSEENHKLANNKKNNRPTSLSEQKNNEQQAQQPKIRHPYLGYLFDINS
ncbi:hypothetical protein Pryu01_00155 [Paraliobacillus ryukyuensis]|uniref:Uncharacterized protein n=1 Tax=Paraliobacillus ryukyuensis TaxID=200904 RepID=A0A366EHG2_9BACI|nr:hypothetical protein [Paraliobacillus ryukyuensis]RBP01773.1 hypothetical protein DES48_101517 [Paraliobacillus ryukyuensis]